MNELSISEALFSISKNQPKYFMCEKCFNILYGEFSSSINIRTNKEVYGNDEILNLNNISIYNDTNNNVTMLCPFCNDGDTQMFEIDKMIIDPIRFLNEKGYYTKFSCEGHIKQRYIDTIIDSQNNKIMELSIPYISFDNYRISSEGFNPLTEKDSRFFDHLWIDYCLFSTKYSSKISIIKEIPEGWYPDIFYNDYFEDFIECIRYYGKVINEGNNKDYELLNIKQKLEDAECEENNNKMKEYTEDYLKIFSNDIKRDIYENKLIEWIASLPNLHRIHTKEEFFKAFNIDENY